MYSEDSRSRYVGHHAVAYVCPSFARSRITVCLTMQYLVFTLSKPRFYFIYIFFLHKTLDCCRTIGREPREKQNRHGNCFPSSYRWIAAGELQLNAILSTTIDSAPVARRFVRQPAKAEVHNTGAVIPHECALKVEKTYHEVQHASNSDVWTTRRCRDTRRHVNTCMDNEFRVFFVSRGAL